MLKAKLHIPTINKNIVSREKLLKKLEQARECKLTLITAPAGYGKTTVVLDWLGKCGLPSAWVSLDSKDNTPSEFWQYVCASLEDIAAGITKDTEYVFSSQELVNANIHIDILIDRLSQLQSDFLLVLDDLHLVSSSSVIAGLSYLVSYLPAKMHLIFISRTPPELGLAAHRIKWQVQRLGEDDLRFKEEEISRFFLARGITLETDELKAVQNYTEGWAAALVAVVLSIEDGGTRDVITALSRSSHDIGGYLRDEVIRTWPPELLSFAMKTSVLDTLSAELCDAVTGSRSGRRLLRDIYETNGFLLDMDGRESSYRYHHLFRSFLQELLEETCPAEIPALYAKAGDWFQEQGLLQEAIEYYLSGGCYREAFELIEHQTDYLIDKKDFGRLLSWTERLPADYQDNSFKIAVIYASYYAETDRYALSRQWIGRMRTLRDHYQYASGPEWSSYSQTVCAMAEANLFVREGNMECMSLVLSAAETDGGKYFRMPEYSDFNTSDIYFYRCPACKVAGLLREDPQQYGKIIESYRKLITKNPGYAPLSVGEYQYESNRLDEALPFLLKAQEEAREVSCPGALVPAMVDIARIKRAGGDMSGAFSVLEECEKQLLSVARLHWLYLLRAFKCRLYLDTWDFDHAEEWFSSGKLDIFTQISRTREFELIIYARVLLAQGRTQDAQLLLQRLLAFTEETKRLHSQVEVLNILSMLAFKDNHTRLALKYIDESLGIGLKEGFLRSFIDELTPMAQILRAYIKSRGKQSEERLLKERKAFAADLLMQMPLSLPSALEVRNASAGEMAGTVLEQLTDQERKVLELVASAATNKEISDRLGISLRTVKTHTGNIYSKLGLKNRAQCIRFVREWGLL